MREHPDEAVHLGMISYAARYPLPRMRNTTDAAFEAFLARTRAAGAADRPPLRVSHGFGRAIRGGSSPRWLSRQRTPARTLLAAAAVVAMVGAGTWTIMRGRAAPTVGGTEAVAWRTFASAHAQRVNVELPDGTRIVLAPESRLRVRQAPERAPNRIVREVELTGEGFFQVAHVAGHPFVIRTPHGTVTQLGTSFDVRAYEGDRATQVAVTEGRVSMRTTRGTAATDAVVLAAGDVARMSGVGVTDVARGADVSRYTSWMHGELRFTNAPLRDVIAAVERWYDVKVELEDPSFATYELTATLRHGSVNDVMDVVVKSLDLRAKRSGNIVRIVGKSAQPTKRP